MNGLKELKKKLSDIEIQNLAMEGCSPTFTVSDIMDLIDSVELAQNLPNACTDTIYRQAAIDLVKFECGEWTGLAKTIGNRINELPSAQPEIIHCRDCKHWSEGDAYSYCNKLFTMGVLDVYDYMTAEDDFCSNAERLEE